MKYLLVALVFAFAAKLYAQCPPTDGSGFSSSDGPYIITTDCPPISATSDIASDVVIDIQSSGSLTVNFSGAGTLFDHVDASFIVTGTLNINNGDLTVQNLFGSNPNFTVNSTGTVNVPDGGFTLGLFGESNSTTMTLDGQLYLSETIGDFVANSGAVLLGGGCFSDADNTINTADDPGANLAGFSGTSPCMPAPVELYSFSVTKVDDNVYLDWVTVSEINNMGFEIQRSLNGIEFTSIGFVQGNGNSNDRISYRFTDYDLPVSTTYYRLKQLDFDGAFEYSPIQLIENTQFDVAPKLYPTIVKDRIQIQGNASLTYDMKVTDLSGKTLFISQKPLHLVELEEMLNKHLYSLFASTYIVHFTAPYQKSHTIRFIKY